MLERSLLNVSILSYNLFFLIRCHAFERMGYLSHYILSDVADVSDKQVFLLAVYDVSD